MPIRHKSTWVQSNALYDSLGKLAGKKNISLLIALALVNLFLAFVLYAGHGFHRVSR